MSRVTYNNSVSDRQTAVDEAMWHVKEALDELQGFGEYEHWFNALEDMFGEMESEKDSLDSYMSGEYAQDQADLVREYNRERLWGDE